MKKVLAIALALVMCLSSVSVLAEGFTPAASYDTGVRTYNAGSITTAPAVAGGGEVTTDVFAGIAGMDYTDEKEYTLNDYAGGLTSSTNWDPLSWETNDDDQIVSPTTIGFYTFVPNSDLSGYSVAPEAAAAMPVDVTAEYVGTYGVAEGETGKVWRIALNPDMCFDDGTKVNADDYIYSMQQQLNPKMLNRRADSWYAGAFVLVNAKNYLFAGQSAASAASAETPVEELYIDMWNFYGLQGATDAEGNECPQYVLATDDHIYIDPADNSEVSAADIYAAYFAPGAAYESYLPEYCVFFEQVEGATWDEVGLKKIDDYTLDFIVANPIADPSYYVPYYLSSNFLVKKDVYEACKTFFDADGKQVETEEEAATVTTSYCRSLETSVSYGPYKLTGFELDKQYTLSRNENWYGYHDGKHLGQYMTDKIVVTVIVESSTAMLAFEKGELDGVSLQAADMDKYASSSYIMYEPQSYTTKVSFNTDYNKLLERGTNSQVLVVDEFREAFAFCIDRARFASEFTGAHVAGFGLLNYMYCYDPFTGGLYRESEGAMDAMVKTYGLTYGEGAEYATLEEAYAAMTGYDMAKAKELMVAAYDKAVASGIYDGESEISIEFRVYNSDEIYIKMINYFDAQLAEACVGSGFEGKVHLKLVVDADYYETNYSGGADAIFTTWGGAAFSPFTVLYECYCDAADGSGQQMEFGYDTSAITMTLTVDGKEVTDTLQNWALWADMSTDVPSLDSVIGTFASYDNPTRCSFLAAMEACFLNWYTTTPVYYRNVASLHSQKINYATYTYNPMTGFGGGSQFATYNYDDAAWAEYIANNTLQY